MRRVSPLTSTEDDVLAFLEDLYDTVLEPAAWDAVAVRLSVLLRADVAICTHTDRPAEVVASLGIPDDAASAYLSRFWRVDEWLAELASGRERVVGTFDPDADLRRSEYFNEFVRAWRWEHALYAGVPSAPGRTSLLAAFRQARHGPFEDEDVRLMLKLAPHLGRVLRLRLRDQLAAVTSETSPLLQALDRARVGVIVTDAEARHRFMNPPARAFAEARALSVSGGHVMAMTAEATHRLHAAVRLATRPRGAEASFLALPDREGNPAVSATVSPVGPAPAPGGSGESTAIIILKGASAPSSSRLQQAYALTPSEAALLAALVRGERLAEYAERSNVKLTTVRTHLRNLFSKTGEQRQAGLVRLALSDPALRLHVDEHE